MDDALDDNDNYNKNRDIKVLIAFDDMIADIEYNKNFELIIKELFYRARYLIESYFRALNSMHYILMKIGNKKELKSIAEKKSGHLDCKDFLKMYNYCTREPHLFMTINARPNATMVFKKNFTELPYKNDQK